MSKRGSRHCSSKWSPRCCPSRRDGPASSGPHNNGWTCHGCGDFGEAVPVGDDLAQNTAAPRTPQPWHDGGGEGSMVRVHEPVHCVASKRSSPGRWTPIHRLANSCSTTSTVASPRRATSQTGGINDSRNCPPTSQRACRSWPLSIRVPIKGSSRTWARMNFGWSPQITPTSTVSK